MRKESMKLKSAYDAPEVEIVCLSLESGCLAKQSGNHEGYNVDEEVTGW